MEVDHLSICGIPNALTRHAPKPCTIGQIMRGIISGRWAKAVNTVRTLVRNEAPKEDLRHAKQRLPAVIFSGVFRTMTKSSLVGPHSGIVCADLDGIEDVWEAIDMVEPLPWVAGWFVSPSGSGLKVLCAANATESAHHYPAWLEVTTRLKERGLVNDQATKNINRLCYVSHDPHAVLRPCVPLMCDLAKTPEPDAEWTQNDCATAQVEEAAALLDAMPPAVEGQGGDRQTYKAIMLGHDYGVPLAEWLPYLEDYSNRCLPPWDERQLRRKAENAYRTAKNPFGLLSNFTEMFNG